MLGNRIKLALRHLWKEKGFTFINIVGLSTGISAALAILLYSGYHFSFDRFHENPDEIYRVLTIDRAIGVSSSVVGITTPAAGPAAYREVAGVKSQVRFMQQGRNLLRVKDDAFYAETFAFVDSNFFSFFNFPLKQGDPKQILRQPNMVLVSESLAKKLFGNQDPVGQTIQAAHTTEPVMVEGIFEDIPDNSHLQFDMVVSIIPSENDSNTRQFLESWQMIAAPTYIRLEAPNESARVLADLKAVGERNDYGGENDNFDLTLQPLLKTHAHSTEVLFDNHNSRKTDIGQIRNLLLVALFLMLIAIFNFMNLSTARSGRRAREIGMRKVLGAGRPQLIAQFLFESIALVALGFIFALVLLEVFGNSIGISAPGGFVGYFLENPVHWVWSIATILFIGALSGIYPAFVLSSFQPIATLKGNHTSQSSGRWLRRVLVTIQFAASIVVIVGMIIVKSQVEFMNAKDMGFEKDYILTLEMNSAQAFQNAETLKEQITTISGVEGTAFANALPGMGYGRTGITPEGYTGEETWIFSVTGVGFDFARVMGIELVAGRFFDREHTSDTQQSVVINQAAADAIGWSDPIGKTILSNGNERTVIGVIKNFHYVGLRYPIEPLMLLPLPNAGGNIAVKFSGENKQEVIAQIEEKWNSINPADPFEYQFFDEEFNQLFTEDEQFARVLSSLNWLAILIACLGLLGLTAYTLQQKTKELGIRKVLGANLPHVVWILSKEFWWVLIVANAVALPVSYYYMNRWLSEFVYRIELQVWPFAIALFTSFAVALLTILSQAIRAEKIDPVKALKQE